jgi:hypothetical protein
MAGVNIDGASKEIQKVVEVLGDHYKAELNTILLGFYHRLANDNLTLDDLERVAARYGLELEKTYLELFMNGEIQE